MRRALSVVLAVALLSGCATETEFTRLYDHYFPKRSDYVQSIYRRYYDSWLRGDLPDLPHTDRLWVLYHAFHGDTAALHTFFNHPNRDVMGEFGESWVYDCDLLLIRYGDDRFSEILAREHRKTREKVGVALETQIDFQLHPFPKTRALYHYRFRMPQSSRMNSSLARPMSSMSP